MAGGLFGLLLGQRDQSRVIRKVGDDRRGVVPPRALRHGTAGKDAGAPGSCVLDEFDEIFARIKARNLPYWADPGQSQRGQINRWDDGRGVYFEDPNGHLLELITKPYGNPSEIHP